MKNISGYLLFFLLILLPLGTILCSCLGYTFKLGSYLAFAVITALLAVTAAVIADAGKVSSVLFALAAPLSLVNAVFYIFECGRNSRIWIILCMLICIVCGCILTVKHGKPLALKIIALILSAFMILPVSFIGFAMLIFGNMGEVTVVRSIESPGGTYYAEVVDDDQGALGGNTLVDVYQNKEFNNHENIKMPSFHPNIRIGRGIFYFKHY